jgi:hypothetical protein
MRTLRSIHSKGLILVAVFSSLSLAVSRCSAADAEDYTGRISRARIFDQPLVWVGDVPPTQAESQELWDALGIGRIKSLSEAAIALEAFIQKHPGSPWSPSLHANLGHLNREQGYFSSALNHWESAWRATKNLSRGSGKQVADYTLIEWLPLLDSLGRAETVKALISETHGRNFPGVWQQIYNQAVETYFSMLNHPDRSYKCGTYSLNAVGQVLCGTNYYFGLMAVPSPITGFSMERLVELAQSNNIDVVAVERPPGVRDLIVPSVVHWKENHYAAITAKRGELYEVDDPTFHLKKLISSEAINVGCSGEFLVPKNQVPNEWRRITSPDY